MESNGESREQHVDMYRQITPEQLGKASAFISPALTPLNRFMLKMSEHSITGGAFTCDSSPLSCGLSLGRQQRQRGAARTLIT